MFNTKFAFCKCRYCPSGLSALFNCLKKLGERRLERMSAIRGRIVNSTRAGRRVFAKKARPTTRTLSATYISRGGGYL